MPSGYRCLMIGGGHDPGNILAPHASPALNPTRWYRHTSGCAELRPGREHSGWRRAARGLNTRENQYDIMTEAPSKEEFPENEDLALIDEPLDLTPKKARIIEQTLEHATVEKNGKINIRGVSKGLRENYGDDTNNTSYIWQTIGEYLMRRDPASPIDEGRETSSQDYRDGVRHGFRDGFKSGLEHNAE